VLAQATVRPGSRAAMSLSATMEAGAGAASAGGIHGPVADGGVAVVPSGSGGVGVGRRGLGLSAQGLVAVGEQTMVAAWASCSPQNTCGGGAAAGSRDILRTSAPNTPPHVFSSPVVLELNGIP
jgi:hypothetical protein